MVEPSKTVEKQPSQVKLVLEKELHLGAQQSKLAKTRMLGDHQTVQGQVGIITPQQGMLVERMCDFTEELWVDELSLTSLLTNWGNCPVVIEKDTVVGVIEERS